ncbi:acyl-phosphate glycerol 3-phosphate acyltransferase [Lentilactobacillus senioris DSM 24302 = JCM 17472]|uniref:Glycerol-3-phosphate acyltransferase n=2 Tax=Lentilactobacillus senioris TaxID=931534 RepID=A0A0R2CQL6_9LACO|nr:acyl-phosphate glycerol 3-phosphate acyltransferase [Lentilactobacillus senioris DSM 24302 = JCM 17472]
MLILAYLLGSIPSGVWVGKLFFHKDIRQFGSGNIGTTNTYRVLGPIAGTLVMILDIAKGSIATMLPVFFHSYTISPLVFGIAAILGHTFSIFDHFKGGKAVATSAGMLLAYRPELFLIAAGIWISLIFITSMVSLASMIAFSIITIIAFAMQEHLLAILALVLTIFIFYRHKTNIKRILAGNENLVPFGLYYWWRNRNQQK